MRVRAYTSETVNEAFVVEVVEPLRRATTRVRPPWRIPLRMTYTCSMLLWSLPDSHDSITWYLLLVTHAGYRAVASVVFTTEYLMLTSCVGVASYYVTAFHNPLYVLTCISEASAH